MKNYIERIQEVIVNNWDKLGLSDYQGEDFTYAQIAANFAKFHDLLNKLDVKAGDKISVCGHNSARWAITLLSTATAHCVTVPILYDFTGENIMGLVRHSESSLLFTDKVKAKDIDGSKVEGLKAIINLDDFSCLYAATPEIQEIIDSHKDLQFEVKKEDVKYEGNMDEITIINYTSGTTGTPKGIMLDQRSISANVEFAIQEIPVYEGESSLSMLPMAHMYGLTFEFLYPFCGGSHVFFLGKTPTPTILLKALAEVKPYILITVPLVMEKIVKSGVMPILNKPAVKVITKIPGLRNIIYNKIHKALMDKFGGNVRQIPVGGAPFNAAVEDVLAKAKIPYAIGYGMTECGPLISYVPYYKNYVKRSCGRELDGYNQVRIDPTVPKGTPGDIQVKGDVVMKGYYKNPEATAAAMTEDGWLRTGDLGVIDEKGNIFIKGRSKCMLLSANGQNIYPEEVENVVNSMPCIAESVVLMRGAALVALVSLSQKDAPEGKTFEQVMDENLAAINAKLPGYSRVSKIEIRESFEHTPKGSIKRFLYS